MLLAGLSAAGQAHSGGLNTEGCHRNSKTQDYHCHKGPPAKNRTSAEQSKDVTTKYNRKQYGGWIDADGDCQNTRHEVLIATSLVPVTLDTKGCKVLHGRWYDFYTGKYHIVARSLDIDHIVALAEAHRSGAAAWSSERKRKFSNSRSNLIAVVADVNRRKSDKDPASWLPPRTAAHCEYMQKWVAIKSSWGLGYDAQEAQKIAALQAKCN